MKLLDEGLERLLARERCNNANGRKHAKYAQEAQMQLERKEYALKWYEYGLDNNLDYISRFMMHWIAFNWMYCESSGGSEWKRIKVFCRQNEQKLLLYDPFDTDEVQVFKEGPVYRVRGAQSNDDPEELCKDIRKGRGNAAKRATSLLLSVYQVRCNLFHRGKSLDNRRDLKLVESSAEIMNGYLRMLLSGFQDSLR